MSEYSKSEVKVGFFIFVSVVVFLFILFMMGALRTAAGTYPFKIQFKFISGLQKGAPVRFAGASVGKVERISILPDSPDTNIEVHIAIRRDIRLRENSEARIDTLGLMGEKYIEISPGSKATAAIPPGSTLVGEDPYAMNVIYKKAMDISSKLDRNLDAMEKLLSNSNSLVEENRPAIHETVANLKDISSEAKSLAADLKAHPWKLFWKGKEKKETSREEGKQPARQKFLGIF